MRINVAVACVLVGMGGGVSLANEWVTTDPGFYVSGNVGPVFVQDLATRDSTLPGVRAETESEAGIGLLAALGYEFGTIRGEGEVGYQTSELDQATVGTEETPLTGHLNVMTFMANGYLDFRGKDLPLVPYLTAGIGIADLTADGVRVPGSGQPGLDDESEDVLAWQIGAGAGWIIDSHWTFDVRYRYLATDEADLGTVEMRLRSHNVYLGLRYNF